MGLLSQTRAIYLYQEMLTKNDFDITWNLDLIKHFALKNSLLSVISKAGKAKRNYTNKTTINSLEKTAQKSL